MAEFKAYMTAVLIIATSTYATVFNITVTDGGSPLMVSTSTESITYNTWNASVVTDANSKHVSNSSDMLGNKTSSKFDWLSEPGNVTNLPTDAHNVTTTNATSDVSNTTQVSADTTATPAEVTTTTVEGVVITSQVNAETTTHKGSSTQISIAASLVMIAAIIPILM